uniref:Uncharacterized protein n=1 Tax=Varanus komodoensis TaxID=61221 RepID=A0A8D2L7M3_VARKO
MQSRLCICKLTPALKLHPVLTSRRRKHRVTCQRNYAIHTRQVSKSMAKEHTTHAVVVMGFLFFVLSASLFFFLLAPSLSVSPFSLPWHQLLVLHVLSFLLLLLCLLARWGQPVSEPAGAPTASPPSFCGPE